MLQTSSYKFVKWTSCLLTVLGLASTASAKMHTSLPGSLAEAQAVAMQDLQESVLEDLDVAILNNENLGMRWIDDGSIASLEDVENALYESFDSQPTLSVQLASKKSDFIVYTLKEAGIVARDPKILKGMNAKGAQNAIAAFNGAWGTRILLKTKNLCYLSIAKDGRRLLFAGDQALDFAGKDKYEYVQAVKKVCNSNKKLGKIKE